MMVILMLVTDIGDSLCWGQVWHVGDRFFTYQNTDSATKILKLSPS